MLRRGERNACMGVFRLSAMSTRRAETRPGRMLIGWMSPGAAEAALAGQRQNELGRPEHQQRAALARRAAEQRRPSFGTKDVVIDLPPELEASQAIPPRGPPAGGSLRSGHAPRARRPAPTLRSRSPEVGDRSRPFQASTPEWISRQWSRSPSGCRAQPKASRSSTTSGPGRAWIITGAPDLTAHTRRRSTSARRMPAAKAADSRWSSASIA